MYYTFSNQSKNNRSSYQNRQSNQNRSPSPLIKTKQIAPSSSKQAMSTLKQQNFNSTHRQMTDIMKLSQNFFKKIVENIRLCEQMNHKNIPQKCLLHNNTYSLYCQNDRKTLCVNCVYQNQSHRKHSIIPINQAIKQLEKDIKNNKTKADNQIIQLNKILKIRIQNQDKMEKQFPQIINKLERHYTSLHQILVRKQKEQINQLNYLKERIKYQNAAFNTEVNKIIAYTIEKLDSKSSQERQHKELLFNHRVSSIMANLHRQIFTPPLYKNLNQLLYGRVLESNIISSQHFNNVGQFLLKSLQVFLNQKDAKSSLHSSPQRKRNVGQATAKLVSKSKEKNSHKRTFSAQTPEKTKSAKKQLRDQNHSSKSIIKRQEKLKTPQKHNTIPVGKNQVQARSKQQAIPRKNTASNHNHSHNNLSKSPNRFQKSKTPTKVKPNSKNQQPKKRKIQQKSPNKAK